MKTCTKCRETKDAAMFPRDKGRADGLFPWCKTCVAAKQVKWREANRTKHRGAVLAYQKANRASKNASDRKRYHDDPVKARTENKRKRSQPEYKAKRRSTYASYRAANLDKLADKEAKRRAIKVAATVEPVSRAEVWSRGAGQCWLCGKPVTLRGMHVDHAVPLSRGGAHSYANCRPACAGCNLRKGAKLPAEYQLEHA